MSEAITLFLYLNLNDHICGQNLLSCFFPPNSWPAVKSHVHLEDRLCHYHVSCYFCAIGTFFNCPHYGRPIRKSSYSSTTQSSLESSSYSLVFFMGVVKCTQGTGPTINLALAITEMALEVTTDLLSKFLTASFWLE